MKTLVLLLTVAAVALVARPLLARVLTAIVSNPPSGGFVGWALAEDFEGAGFQASWNVGGDVGGNAISDPDYATAPAPLLGSESYRVTQGSGGQKYIYNNYMPFIATGTNTTGVFFMVNFLTNTAGTVFFALADNASDETNLKLSIQAGGVVRIDSNGTTADTTATITVKHTNHFWVYWESNVIAAVGWTNSYSTNVVAPVDGSPEFAKVTSGLGTKSVQQVFLMQRDFSSDHDTAVFDHVRVQFTNITGFGYP